MQFFFIAFKPTKAKSILALHSLGALIMSIVAK